MNPGFIGSYLDRALAEDAWRMLEESNWRAYNKRYAEIVEEQGWLDDKQDDGQEAVQEVRAAGPGDAAG